MFKNLSMCLVLSMFAIISFPLIAGAQTETPVSPEAFTTTIDESAPNQMSPEEKVQNLQMRINAAKEKATSKITAAQERRIAGLCKASQTLIQNYESKISTTAENRQTKYSSVSEKLKTLSTKLALSGADVAELNIAIEQLDAKSANNIAVMNEFITSITDLSTMDCVSDPSGFKAVLETIRTQLQEVFIETTNIRNYINETIKPILQGIRSSLQPTMEGEGTN